jgi:hypothetical protein
MAGLVSPEGGSIQVVVYGWEPGENLEIYHTENLSRAQSFARKWTKTGGAAFATLHIPDDPRVHLYARGRLSRRLAPRGYEKAPAAPR